MLVVGFEQVGDRGVAPVHEELPGVLEEGQAGAVVEQHRRGGGHRDGEQDERGEPAQPLTVGRGRR